MDFGLLGPLRVNDGQRTWPVPAAKQRVVLAALLLRDGGIVGVDELVRTIWDETPPGGAVTALRNHVMRLRRTIGPDAAARVHTRTPGYLIDVRDGEFDFRTFIQLRNRGAAAAQARRWEQARTDLRRALDLWRGEPLLDVPSKRLRSRESRRLDELRVDTLRQRIDVDLQLGDHARLIAELGDLVREHPLQEGFHAQLMMALYRAGRQSEALAVYQEARRVLIEEVGVEPGRELTQLHRRVLTLDPTLAAPAPATVTVRPAPLAPAAQRLLPAQMPADLVDFTGRVGVTDHLCDLLTPAAHHPTNAPGPVALLTGAGGIGKTTLAVHVAHLLRGRFPDGQIYANLHGSTEVPPGAQTLAARLLRDLGVDAAHIPVDPDERASLYRSILAERRVLIVLDDARDTAAVRTLIPGSPGCAVLITSRNRLPTLAASGRIDLDTMEPDECAALIARIIGAERTYAEPDAVADVLHACAGLPLAIRIAAARLIARPTETIRSFADRLTDTKARLDQLEAEDLAVRATFTLSYDRLPEQPGAARAFRLLGLWSGLDIGIGAASALCGEPPSATEAALETLIDAQLLQSPTPSRYRHHDLLHVYARERVVGEESPADRDAAVHRLLTWYLHTVVNADLSLRPHRIALPLDPIEPDVHPLTFDDYQAALTWCQSEQANLVAAVRNAEAHALHGHAWRLALAVWSYHYIGKRHEDSLATGEIGLRCARLLGDKEAEGAVLATLGTALCESHRHDEAIEAYKQALVLHDATDDRARQPGTLNSLAVAYGETGQFALALEAFDTARQMHAQAGNTQGEGLALGNMALCYAELGQPDEALLYYQQALRAYRAVGDRYCEAICLANLGEAHAKTGAHALAWGLFEDAITIHTETGNQYGRAATLLSLGHSQTALDEHAAARESWRQAHAVFTDLDHPDAERTRALLER